MHTIRRLLALSVLIGIIIAMRGCFVAITGGGYGYVEHEKVIRFIYWPCVIFGISENRFFSENLIRNLLITAFGWSTVMFLFIAACFMAYRKILKP